MYNIKEVQKALLRKGFDPGPADGLMGPRTRAAIVEFKKSIGYKARPYLGPLTIAALFEGRLEACDDYPRPRWLRVALTYLGLREYPGNKNNSQILEWWAQIRSYFTDDETPWCAAYVGGVLEECGIRSSRSAAARSYQNWGYEIEKPVVGAIAVMWRGSRNGRSGHVGIVAGEDQDGNLMVVGGNQGNQVTISPFDYGRILSYRMPYMITDQNIEDMNRPLPCILSDGNISKNEA